MQCVATLSVGTRLTVYAQLDFKNYTTDWADGRVICAVAAALVPTFQLTGRTYEKAQAVGNIRDALNALTSIGVSPLLDVRRVCVCVAHVCLSRQRTLRTSVTR